MGGNTSKIIDIPDKTSEKTLHEIASKYILTQNSKDLFRLANPDNCKKLVVLTSKAISEHFSPRYITYLNKSIGGEKMTEEKLLFFNKDSKNIESIDKKNTNKQQQCIGIARYYVKIAHLFSAIALTINPIYKWNKKDSKGNDIISERDGLPIEQKAQLFKIDKHPDFPNLIDNSDVKISFNHNFCTKRHSRLVKIKKKLEKNGLKFIDLTPMCQTREKDITESNIKTLAHETGFEELEKLYQDVYNYETGEFNNNEKSEGFKKYLEHLKILYKTFQNKTDSDYDAWNIDKNKRFIDVLVEYQYNKESCVGDSDSAKYQKYYEPNDDNIKFTNYIQFIKEMIDRSETSRKEIISVLYEVFKLRVKDPKKPDEDSDIVINPELKMVKLNEIINNVRNLIFNLYVTCEKDYKEALDRLNAIIEDSKVTKALNNYVDLKRKNIDITADPQDDKNELQSKDSYIEPESKETQDDNLETVEELQKYIEDNEKKLQKAKLKLQEKMTALKKEPEVKVPQMQEPQVEEVKQPQVEEVKQPQVQEVKQPQVQEVKRDEEPKTDLQQKMDELNNLETNIPNKL